MVAQRGANSYEYSAGNQKHYLRAGSGIGKQQDARRMSESHAFINRDRVALGNREPQRFAARNPEQERQMTGAFGSTMPAATGTRTRGNSGAGLYSGAKGGFGSGPRFK